MRFFAKVLTWSFATLPLLAVGPDDARLDYRLKVRLRDDPAEVDSGFRMVAGPALVTGNRVQRLRMGRWKIEPPARGAAPSPVLLARTLRLCYFSGPTSQAVPLATGMKFGNRWCRLWQVQTPPEVGAYVYLVEVSPGLLALAYLSATFPQGEVRSMEIHLAGVSLGRRAVPAEEGTALLKTLQHWSDQAIAGDSAGPETEEVP